MPLLVQPVLRSFRMHGLAVHHARESDCEVGNIDHLLHFAIAFGFDLAGLERDQAAQSVLGLAQSKTDAPDELAAAGRGHFAPLARVSRSACNDSRIVLRRARAYLCDR